MKAKVQFTVNRSGMISSPPNLLESSGNFYFDQAAVRTIQQANPFPPMPDEFYKQTATFSVDLMPKD
jgi:TonB family protein